MINKDSAIIFSAYTRRISEWDTARGIEARRNTDGTVYIRISSETEREDIEYKSKTMSASESEAFGRALLCISEDDSTFDAIIDRSARRDKNVL